MAYILDDDGRALVADVKNFCDKEVKNSARLMMNQANGLKKFMIRLSNLVTRCSKFPKNTADLDFPEKQSLQCMRKWLGQMQVLL